MQILEILTSPWAMVPSKLDEITNIYATHLRGDKIDIKAIEAKAGMELSNKPQGYTIENGVAVIPVFGVLGKKMNLLQQISGGSSMQMIARDVREAVEDPDVERIALLIESPGGTVDGTEDVANAVLSVRGKKPIVAIADGLMASAAYWIGSAADKIYVGNNTTIVGSIGVVSTHIDRSKQLKDEGLAVTEVYAGKYKRITSDTKPLSKEGKKVMQDEVDYLYSIFVDVVASNRGVDVETVINDMADGRTFIGQQAIEAGLADGAVSLEQYISGNVTLETGSINESVPEALIEEENEMDITLDYIRENHADIAEKLVAEGVASVADPKEAAKQGADDERARIQGVLGMGLVGHEKLIQKLAFDGSTTPDQAAVQVLKAEQGTIKETITDIEKDAEELAVVAPSADVVPIKDNMTEDEKIEKEWKQDKEAREDFSDYDAFYAYKKAMGSGLVKILSRGDK